MERGLLSFNSLGTKSGVSLFNGLFPFTHVLVPMSSPAFLLQKLCPGKCPENSPALHTRGRLALSRVLLSPVPLQSASVSHFLPVQLQVRLRDRGTLG